MRLLAKLAKSVLSPGAPITAELTIYNGERYSMSVNKRMAVTPDLPPIFGGEVMLDVREVTTGHVSLFRCSLDRLDEGGPNDHVILRPGEAVSAIASTDCCDTRTPGRYSVVFRYRDYDRAPAPDGIHLTRELVSDPAVIEVLEGDGAVPPGRDQGVPPGQTPI